MLSKVLAATALTVAANRTRFSSTMTASIRSKASGRASSTASRITCRNPSWRLGGQQQSFHVFPALGAAGKQQGGDNVAAHHPDRVYAVADLDKLVVDQHFEDAVCMRLQSRRHGGIGINVGGGLRLPVAHHTSRQALLERPLGEDAQH